MTPPQRAVLAAEIIDGRIVLQGLTAKSIAAIVGANSSYVYHPLRATPEQREQVRRGERPLILRALPRPKAIDWGSVDDAALADVARAVGIDRMLNAAAAAEHATT